MSDTLAYTIPDACKASAASRSAIYRAVKAGELTLRKRGTRSLIMADELRRWLQSLPVASST
jgi:excisionase family DNA binding protein